MQSASPVRVSKVAVVTSIVLVLLAMMLPVCHIHPLLDKAAPDHCTICISLHAAAPMGAHSPSIMAVPLPVDRVVVVAVQSQTDPRPRLAASRAPPLPAC
jgi:hypothetical protein